MRGGIAMAGMGEGEDTIGIEDIMNDVRDDGRPGVANQPKQGNSRRIREARQ